MDQDSSNGGGERRNWRERLGIAKEPPKASSQPLPKLAGEFKPAKAEPAKAGPAPGAAAPRAEPRLGAAPARPAMAGQPAGATGAAVRPAPMAPRPGQPVRPGAAPAAPARPAAAQASRQAPTQTAARPAAPAPAQPAAPRPAAPAAAGAASDEFADRLRKQREAAEKLAQQRAEARAQQIAAGTPPAAAAPVSGDGPRFTFAPEELEQAPPLAAAPSVAQPVSRPQGQWAPGYPPLPSPPPGGYQRPSTAYPYGQPYNPQNRPGASRPGAYPPPEGWARPGAAPGGVYTPAYQPPEPPGGGIDAEGARADDVPYPDHMRPAPRPRPPAPAQRRLPPPPAEDDVFEAEPEARPVRRQPPPRGRGRELAAPQRNYSEYDEEYDEAPRRRGPLWLLLGLLAVALLAGAMLWAYYQYAGRTAGGQTGEIPVIAPSEQPVKATPDPATAPQQQGGSVTQPQGRKQIYDRILGDDTVEPARVVPTEEQPVPPAPAAPPAATAPQGGEVIEPVPVAPPAPGQQGGSGQPEPLPLPPPPGQQGSAEPPAAAPMVQAAAAPAAESEQIAQSTTGAAGTPTATVVEEPAPAPPPPPKKKAKVAAPEPDTEAIVSAPEPPAPADSGGAVQTGALSPPAPGQAAVNEPLPLPPAPQVPATAQPAPAQQGGLTGLISQIGSQFGGGASDVAETPAQNQPRKRSIRDDDPLEGTRVPLNATGVAQAPAQAQQDQQVALNLPPAPQQTAPEAVPQESVADQQAFAPQPAPAPAPAPAQQGGFLQNLQRNLGLGTGTRQPATVVTGGQQAANQQMAALPPADVPAAAPAPAVPAGGGFQVQLASFTSEGEAESEFQRLKQRHPGLLGNLQPRIQAADLGSLGTRYRLGVAPLGSREQAAKLCNSLIAAGVRDCTVRAF